MNQRSQRQDVQRVLLRHRPLDLRVVRQRVSNCSEQAYNKVDETTLLPSFGLRHETVDGQWR